MPHPRVLKARGAERKRLSTELSRIWLYGGMAALPSPSQFMRCRATWLALADTALADLLALPLAVRTCRHQVAAP